MASLRTRGGSRGTEMIQVRDDAALDLVCGKYRELRDVCEVYGAWPWSWFGWEGGRERKL